MSLSVPFHLHSIEQASDPALADLRQLLLDYQSFLEIDLCFQSFEQEMAELPGDYAPPFGRLYVLRAQQGAAAGCIALRPLALPGFPEYPKPCEMKRLYLRPEFQGQGLGKALAKRIVADARQIGYSHMLLDTLPKLHAAIGVYTKMGFEPVPAYNDNPIPGVRHFSLRLSD